jgi:hypothetical protein
MDIKQQLERLLDLTDQARRHALQLNANRDDALSELDAAEYDLQRLVAEIRGLLPDGDRDPAQGLEPRTARQSR